jgi:H-type lectin domain
MKRLNRNSIGIDQGEVVLFSDFEHDGVMWKGEGPRQARAYVLFSDSFVEPPVVRVSLSMWDMSNSANARADITYEDVTEKGFVILFRTWGDTRVARVRVNWQAIGTLQDDEVWEVD